MMTANNRAITITNHITIWTSVLVIIAAAILSFTALRDLFVSIGLFAIWLSFLFPLLFDLAEVAAAVSVLNAKLQGEDDRFAWRLVIGFTLAGIAANVAHAYHAYSVGRIDAGQLALATGATSLFPLSIALVTHLVKRTIERQINRAGHVATIAELTAKIGTGRETAEKLSAQIDTLTAKRDALKADVNALRTQTGATGPRFSEATIDKARAIYADSPGISGSAMGRAVGISERKGRDLLKLVKAEVGPVVLNGHHTNGFGGAS